MEDISWMLIPCKESLRAKNKDGHILCYKPKYGYHYYHRYLYAKHHGIDLKSTEIVRHLCNNPGCVEIQHLAIGTQKDNMQDAMKAGTHISLVRKKDWYRKQFVNNDPG